MDGKPFKKWLPIPLIQNFKYSAINNSFIELEGVGLAEVMMMTDARRRVSESFFIGKLHNFVKEIREKVDSHPPEMKVNEMSSVCFDIYHNVRCTNFMNRVACSTNCRYRHSYPRDDGVWCKYYYLKGKCLNFDCRYYHGEVGSSKRNARKDKRRFESGLRKQRGSANSYPYPQNNMMTDKNNSFQYDIQKNCKTKCESLSSESENISESNDSDENSLSNLSSIKGDSATDSGPKYYFSSSDSENDSPTSALRFELGNVLNTLRTSSVKPIEKLVTEERDPFDDIDVNDYIVWDFPESCSSSEEIEPTSDNENGILKSPLREDNQSPEQICIKIKNEDVSIIEISDDEGPQKEENDNEKSPLEDDNQSAEQISIKVENEDVSIITISDIEGPQIEDNKNLTQDLAHNIKNERNDQNIDIPTNTEPLIPSENFNTDNVKKEMVNSDFFEASVSFINNVNNESCDIEGPQIEDIKSLTQDLAHNIKNERNDQNIDISKNTEPFIPSENFNTDNVEEEMVNSDFFEASENFINNVNNESCDIFEMCKKIKLE